MGSQGGGTTTTTQNTTPWAGQIPYLQDVFSTAKQAWMTANTYPQSPLYNTYINAATGTQAPGGASLENALQSGLNFAPTAQPSVNSLLNSGYQNSLPYLQSLDVVSKQANAASPDVAATTAWLKSVGGGGIGNLQDQYSALSGMGGQGYANPAIAGLFGAAGAGNQYIDPMAQVSGMAMANPALSQLQQTASGAYLSPDSNPYLQRAVQSALDQSRASIAGQFNQGGRFGSGQMQDVQSRALGDIAAQAYTQQYGQERGLQQQAQQALGSQYLQGVGQFQQGLGQAAGLTQGQQGLGQQALGAAGNLWQGAGAQNLAAQQAAAGVAQNQIGNLLSSLGLQAGTSESALQRALQGQEGVTQGYYKGIEQQQQGLQAGTDAFLQAQQLQNQAIGLAPYAQSVQQGQLANLGNAAQLQQQLMQQPEQMMWDRLANYAGLIGGNYGGTTTGNVPYYTNPVGTAIGGLGGLASLGMGLSALFSSRRFKHPSPEEPDTDRLTEGLRDLPISAWRYHGDSTPHVGPYAEDFAAAFGFGDGTHIPLIDAIGVLFIVLQRILQRVDRLERTPTHAV